MNNLVRIIKYENKWYEEVQDNEGKFEIEKLADKLAPFENEILFHKDANINITPKAVAFITCLQL